LFARRMHRSMWNGALLGLLLLTGLGLLLGGGCSGGGGGKEGAAPKHSSGGGAQISKADLDAALKKSFKESDAPGVVAAVQSPDFTWVRARGWRTALPGSR